MQLTYIKAVRRMFVKLTPDFNLFLFATLATPYILANKFWTKFDQYLFNSTYTRVIKCLYKTKIFLHIGVF
jgi:hypothetical protein